MINSLPRNFNKTEPTETFIMLNDTEKQILRLISLELNNKEIAERLYLSKHTIHTYRNRLLKKFNVTNVAGLIRRCFELSYDLPMTEDYFYAVKLSDRERQIMSMIASEMSNREIAESLELSRNTIDTYRQNLYHKLNVHSSAGMIRVAYQNQLLSLAS